MSSFLRHLLIGAVVAAFVVQISESADPCAATCYTGCTSAVNGDTKCGGVANCAVNSYYTGTVPTGTCSACNGEDTNNDIAPGGASTVACGCKAFGRAETGAGTTGSCGPCKPGYYHTTAATGNSDQTFTAGDLPTDAAKVTALTCTSCPALNFCTDTTTNNAFRGAAPVLCSSLRREPGTSATAVAQPTCGQCAKGSVWGQADVPAAAAPTATSKSDKSEGVLACTACPAGKTSAAGVKATCTGAAGACTAADIASACTACAAGKYSNSTSGDCNDCSGLNRVAPATVSNTCAACTDAYYDAAASGTTRCSTTCASIFRADIAGSGCGACLSGYIGTETGTDACPTCEAAQNRTKGATANTCGDCVTGFFLNGAQCLNCTSLNRASGVTNTCGACNAGFVGTSDQKTACVTQATWNNLCAGLNRVLGASYPACGACIAGAAGSATSTNATCTICTGTTYPAAGATACATCAVTASQQGNGGRRGPTPACTACNTTSGVCTACATGSFPLGAGQGCEYRCPANQAPTTNNTVWPCETCLLNGCTACSNLTGVCTACPTGFITLTTAFGGCAKDVSSVIPPVTSTGTINSTGSQAVLDTITQDLQTASNPTTVAELLAQGVLTSGVLKVLTSNAATSPVVIAVGATTAPVGTTAEVTMQATINGQLVTVTFTVTATAEGLIISAVVANPALFSDPTQQVQDIKIMSVSVTPTIDSLPSTSAGKMRRLSTSTQAIIPAGTTVTLTLNGAVPTGRIVYCGRALPNRGYYETYEPAVLVSGTTNQYKCTIILPEGSTYALVALLPTASSSGVQFMVASYKNYHTDVGLGVGLGVGIPVLIAILVTIFCCIGRPAKAVGVPTYGYGVPAPVTYAAPY